MAQRHGSSLSSDTPTLPLQVLVRGIPNAMKIGDLREFFFDDIERGDCFACFHFMAQPDFDDSTARSSTSPKLYCVLVKLQSDAALKEFVKAYNGREWETKKGVKLDRLCVIDKVYSDNSKRSDAYRRFLEEMVANLPAPPPALPQGNVGTPIATIRQSINKCLIPASALAKMGIDFRGSVEAIKHPKYNQVRYMYARDNPPGMDRIIAGENAAEAESISDDVEDWDRWEAQHGDEEDEEEHYLYEEKIEKKWEKGGSGLVHYTDAIYWNKQKGDKEEQELLKEHGDDWIFERDPKSENPYPLVGRSTEEEESIRRERMKKLRKLKRKEEMEREEEERFTERTRKRARLLDELEGPKPISKSSSSSFSGIDLFPPTSTPSSTPSIGKRYLESYGWREGEPIGSGLLEPVKLDAVVERRGLGFVPPRPGEPHRTLINKELNERFKKPYSSSHDDQ